MSTYAVVQFLKDTQKECAIVPLIWLTDNNSACYWPNVTSDVKFKALVKSNAVYKSSWKKFDVNAVLHTEDDYDAAEQFMNTYTEQITSSDNATKIRNERIFEQNDLVDSKHNKLKNDGSNNTTTIRKRKQKQKDPKMSIKRRKKVVKSPTPVSSNEDSIEDSTEDSTESSSTSNVNSSENNNLDIIKKKKIKRHTFINKEENDTGLLLQRTISGPLQNQLDHTINVQSSLQEIPTVPVIKSIQSVSGVVKQSFAKLGCKNTEETSISTKETDETDQECQSSVGTPLSTPRFITNKISRIKNFAQLPEIEFQQLVLSYVHKYVYNT